MIDDDELTGTSQCVVARIAPFSPPLGEYHGVTLPPGFSVMRVEPAGGSFSFLHN
jgi:hypothetical protein